MRSSNVGEAMYIAERGEDSAHMVKVNVDDGWPYALQAARLIVGRCYRSIYIYIYMYIYIYIYI